MKDLEINNLLHFSGMKGQSAMARLISQQALTRREMLSKNLELEIKKIVTDATSSKEEIYGHYQDLISKCDEEIHVLKLRLSGNPGVEEFREITLELRALLDRKQDYREASRKDIAKVVRNQEKAMTEAQRKFVMEMEELEEKLSLKLRVLRKHAFDTAVKNRMEVLEKMARESGQDPDGKNEGI